MPKLHDAKILDLISSFYDAAADEGLANGWESVYADISRLTNAGRGSLNVYVEKYDEYRPVAGTFPADFHTDYSEHFHSVNPFKRAVAKLKSGQRLNRQESMADGPFRKTEFYSDYYRKYDIFHFEHRIFLADNGISAGISLTRSESDGNFSRHDLKLLDDLVPHLQRAFRVYLRLSAAKRQNDVLAESVDRIPRAVLAIDADRNIIFANRAAEDMLRHPGSGLESRQARLRASEPENDRKLKAMVGGICDPKAVLPPNDAGLMHLDRAFGRPPLQLFVAPVSERHFRFDGGEKLALVFITDPEQRSERVVEVLSGLYKLTLAEVRLATMIADGKTLFDASETLGVSMNTVRTHLKHIFAKTGTNRQGELMKMIALGPASLRNLDGDM